MTDEDLILERDAALALAERRRLCILRLAHMCEEGVRPRVIAARAREEIRVKGE